MLKKIGVSLLAAMILSSVALACDYSSIDDDDFLCEFSLVDDGGNKQVSKQEERKMLKFDKEVVKKILMEDGYLAGSIFDKVDYDKIETDESGTRKFIERPPVGPALFSLSISDSRLQPILDAYVANRTIYNN